eukprot:6459649-Amphidinium_carterae.1
MCLDVLLRASVELDIAEAVAFHTAPEGPSFTCPLGPPVSLRTTQRGKAMAPKAMKSKTEAITMSEAYKTVAEKMELKPKDVKGIMQSLLELSTEQVKKSGSFKLA